MDVSSYLKLPEAAQRLGVSEKTARRYIKSGALSSIFVGNAYRVHPDELDSFVQRTSVGHNVAVRAEDPKADAPPSRAEGSLEDRRTLHLELLAEFALRRAEAILEAAASGEVTPAWAYESFKEVASILLLMRAELQLLDKILPEGGTVSEREKRGLERTRQAEAELGRAGSRLAELADFGAPERDELEDRFAVIIGGLSA